MANPIQPPGYLVNADTFATLDGQPLGYFPVLTGETGVTNARYSYGNVRRYGALGLGVTDDAPAFNAAIAYRRSMGGGTITIPQPPTRYLCLTPIDATDCHGVIFRAECSQDVNAPVIHAAHTGHIFDLAASYDCVFENVVAAGDATTPPTTAFFLARNAAGAGAGRHRFMNCRTSGYFTVAPLYSYASEENEYTGCYFANTRPNTDTAIITAYNNAKTHPSAPLTSSFITIATGSQSMIVANIWGGQWWAAGGTASALVLDGVDGMRVDAPWAFASQSNADGFALVKVNLANAPSNNCSFSGIIGENSATHLQQYGFWFGGNAAPVTCTGWRIADCRLPSRRKAIYCDSLCTIDSSHIEQIGEPEVRGIDLYNFNNSFYKGVNNAFGVRGALDKSVLVGNSVNWTIAQKSNWIFLNTLTGKITSSAGPNNYVEASFTPTIVIGSGAPTSYSTQRGTCTRIGNRVWYTIELVIDVLGRAVGSVSVQGFPIAAAAGENHPIVIMADTINLTAGEVHGYIAAGTTIAYLHVRTFGSPTTNANLSQANLTGSSAFRISGSYRVP